MNILYRYKTMKATLTIGIALTFIISTMTVSAANPPVISNIQGDGVQIGLAPSYFYIRCTVTDNQYVSEVYIRMTGPNNYSINESMYLDFGQYIYYLEDVPSLGSYAFTIWAVDNSGNTATSENYGILILENCIDPVYVDDSNTGGPWDGTSEHPLRKITHGLIALNANGTMYINNGFYQTSTTIAINKGANIVGESRENVIIDGAGTESITIIQFNRNNITLSNCTITNGGTSGRGIKSLAFNKNVINNCDVHNVYVGAEVTYATILNCNFYNNSDAGLYATTQNIVTNCTIYNNRNSGNTGVGIRIGSSNQVTSCSVYNNNKGIALIMGSPTLNIFSNCEIFNNTYCGIFMPVGLNNEVLGCNIHDQPIGIQLESRNNIIQNCTISNHNQSGIQIAYTNGKTNFIYHNNFVNNSNHVTIYNTQNNIWDDGTTGNYWDDYEELYPNANIVPATGTWDTPYVLNASNIDHHPWVYPFGWIDTIPPDVRVIFPNGGETLTGDATVTWTAHDFFTSSLDGTIMIEYSDDNGATWTELASELNNTGSYTWDTTTVPDGDEYLIQVSASDAWQNSGSDVSDAVFSLDNYLPLEADAHGPYSGIVGHAVSFNGSVSGGLAPYTYEWDFGDNTTSEEQNPTHGYTQDGEFTATLTVTDAFGTSVSDSSLVTIIPDAEPILAIGTITGGLLQVGAEIKNIGDADATNVTWSIQVKGGLFGLINVTGEDTFITLAPAATEVGSAKSVFGLGTIMILVTASADGLDPIEKQAAAFVIGPFILSIQEL